MSSTTCLLLTLLSLVTSGLPQLQSLSQDIREELLNTEDIAVVETRENTGKISAVVSPSSHRCLLVPGDLGCTRWVVSNCRRLPRTTSREIYHPDCTEVEGRMLRDCQEEANLVPVQNSLVVCGVSMTRECEGPCFNCPNFCSPQFEETCWTNHKVKKVTRICDASSCTEVEAGLEQVVAVKVEEEEEELEQVERLEAVSSCSQQRVGEVCAPVNCKFTTEKQECSTQQNRTETVRLSTKRCRICQKRKTQVINLDERCEDVLFKDCRERFTVVWKKFCSDYSETVDRLRILLNATETRFALDGQTRPAVPEFDDLLDKSLTPVNSLVIETLRKIKIQDLNKDSIVIITPSPTTDGPPVQLQPLQGETNEDIILKENMKKETDDQTEQDRKSLLQALEVTHKPLEVNVNVKYAFEDAADKSAEETDSQNTLQAASEAAQATTSESGKDVAAAGSSGGGGGEIIYTSSSGTANNAGTLFSAVIVGSTEGGAVYLGGGAVYYDPSLQVLNGRSNVEESTTSVTTTGATSATTSTTTSTTTLRSAAHLERPLSSTELLRLCFLNNLGCEFGLNEVDRSGERSSATTTVTTSTTRSTSTTTRLSRKAVKTGKDKAVSDKFRLCFEFGICSEEDIQANRQQPSAAADGTTAKLAAVVVPTTLRPARSIKTTTAAVRSDRYGDLKARAVACIWRGDC